MCHDGEQRVAGVSKTMKDRHLVAVRQFGQMVRWYRMSNGGSKDSDAREHEPDCFENRRLLVLGKVVRIVFEHADSVLNKRHRRENVVPNRFDAEE